MKIYDVMKKGIKIGSIEKIGISVVFWSPLLINGKLERLSSIPIADLQEWVDALQGIASGLSPKEWKYCLERTFGLFTW